MSPMRPEASRRRSTRSATSLAWTEPASATWDDEVISRPISPMAAVNCSEAAATDWALEAASPTAPVTISASRLVSAAASPRDSAVPAIVSDEWARLANTPATLAPNMSINSSDSC